MLTPKLDSKPDLLAELNDADFVIAVTMDAEMIAAAPHVKLIQLAGVGFDRVDILAATRASVPVAQTIEGTIIGVAEHTVLLVLALYKQLLRADASLRQGEWLVWQLRPESYTLDGKTIGILGLGRIGRGVARRLRAFGTEICYHDTVRADHDTEQELGVRYMQQDELLSAADVVTLHLPLMPETRKFFGEREFGLMKPSAVFINTSRGELVDEAALVRSLEEKRIAGAGLDVFDTEPMTKDNPLLKLPNTVLTPHIATGTRDSIIAKTVAACDNFRRVIEGARPLNVLNSEIYELVEQASG